jgi:hypothetical protein
MDLDGILIFVFIKNQFKILYFGTLWNIVYLILLYFVSNLFLTLLPFLILICNLETLYCTF